MGYIYQISNDINNKLYIGQTRTTLSHRWSQHISNALNEQDIKQGRRSILYNAIRKYGSQHFTISIIEECDNSLLNEKEIYYIQSLNTLTPNGYNILRGGNGYSKLDYDEVVKWFYECGCNQAEVYRRYGIIPRTTRKILREKGILNKSKRIEGLEHYNHNTFYECDNELNILHTFSSIADAQIFYPEIAFNSAGLASVFSRQKKGLKRRYHGHLFIKANDYKDICQLWNNSANS